MNFRRTSSGLSNLHLFLKVDIVVFTEGGSASYSINDVLAGSHNIQAIDLLFWSKIFNLFLPTKKLAFRAIGSKSTVTSIANDIESSAIKNVYVAMDRDIDNLKGSLIQASGVFYTFGYSWENDVWSADVLEEVFYTLCPVSRDEIQVREEIDSCYNQFRRDIYWAVYADILLGFNGSSFFPRKKPESIFSTGANRKPAINRQRIYALIKEKKLQRMSKLFLGKKINFCPIDDCYGHVVSAFSYRILVYLLASYSSSPSLPKDYAYAVGIDKFISKLVDGELVNCFKNYENQFALLP